MISDHPGVLISTAALALIFVLAAGAAAETIAGTDLEAAELVADLPWAFEVTVEPTIEDAPILVPGTTKSRSRRQPGSSPSRRMM